MRRLVVEYETGELVTIKVQFFSLPTFTLTHYTVSNFPHSDYYLSLFVFLFPRVTYFFSFFCIFSSMTFHSGHQADGFAMVASKGVGTSPKAGILLAGCSDPETVLQSEAVD